MLSVESVASYHILSICQRLFANLRRKLHMAHLKRTRAAHRSRSGDIFIPRVYVFIYPLAVR